MFNEELTDAKARSDRGKEPRTDADVRSVFPRLIYWKGGSAAERIVNRLKIVQKKEML